MSDECGCDYSYTCPRHSELFELQARDARTENKVDVLQDKLTELEKRLSYLENRAKVTP